MVYRHRQDRVRSTSLTILSSALVDLDEPKSTIFDRVPRPIEPLVSRHVDAIVGCDTTSGIGERKLPASIGSRPSGPVSTTLLGAFREGEDGVEIGVGCDVQVGWGVCDLFEDVDLVEVE